jgi:hypothetical protein
LNTILWIIQILLAILFTLFGLMLLTTRPKILEKYRGQELFTAHHHTEWARSSDRPRLVTGAPLYLAWIEGRVAAHRIGF